MTIVKINRCAGFSLFELIMVLILLGILSVYALSTVFDKDSFAAQGFFDDTVNAVRFGQKLAVSTGCAVQVSIVANGYQVSQRSAGCTSGGFVPVSDPVYRNTAYSNFDIPNGYSLSPATITFNAIGIPGSDAAVSLTSGSDVRSFSVSGQTGLVW